MNTLIIAGSMALVAVVGTLVIKYIDYRNTNHNALASEQLYSLTIQNYLPRHLNAESLGAFI